MIFIIIIFMFVALLYLFHFVQLFNLNEKKSYTSLYNFVRVIFSPHVKFEKRKLLVTSIISANERTLRQIYLFFDPVSYTFYILYFLGYKMISIIENGRSHKKRWGDIVNGKF